jgi:hypothetical protein
MRLIIENVRSLAGHHEIPVRPLTVLVGENSSGKSTFLAALSAVSDKRSFPGIPALNSDPYDLGSFETIATYKGGKAGRAKKFGLGYSVEFQNAETHVTAAYAPLRGETKLSELRISSPEGRLRLEWSDGRLRGTLAGLPNQPEIALDRELLEPSLLTQSLPIILLQSIPRERRDGSAELFDKAFALANRVSASIPITASIAPIRSTPKRTYDLISDEYDPGGDHIPFVLARLLDKNRTTGHKKTPFLRWLSLVVILGSSGGLFQNA